VRLDYGNDRGSDIRHARQDAGVAMGAVTDVERVVICGRAVLFRLRMFATTIGTGGKLGGRGLVVVLYRRLPRQPLAKSALRAI
jgi:hypothetical protein